MNVWTRTAEDAVAYPNSWRFCIIKLAHIGSYNNLVATAQSDGPIWGIVEEAAGESLSIGLWPVQRKLNSDLLLKTAPRPPGWKGSIRLLQQPAIPH